MGKSRATRRSASGLVVNVFAANTNLGWKVVRQVPVEHAIEQVALKRWREIWFDNGELAGFQPLKSLRPDERKAVLVDRLAAVTITLAELERNAGLRGPSHTIGMPEWKRLKRHARFDERKILPPEDAIEKAIEKVRMWPYPANVLGTDKNGAPIFGDKAVRVYPVAPKPRVKKHANSRRKS